MGGLRRRITFRFINMVDFLRTTLLLLLAVPAFAGPSDDNHVHVEQVGSGDDLSINIEQIGYGNFIDFSFAHSGNTFNLEQNGNGNSISWVSYWGSGKSWGGDIDGVDNTESVEQWNGATYGRHIWGDDNTVDVYPVSYTHLRAHET